MAQILSIGELLIDFTPVGTTDDGRLLFARNPGGAPANVAVQAARCGSSGGFLGCVGQDMFGLYLKETLENCGVDTTGLTLNEDYATTLAFVQLSEMGDRDFSFYRNPGADTRLTYSLQGQALVKDCSVLCFGSLLLTAEPSRGAVEQYVDYARALGKITAYDPNWRPPLWQDKTEGVLRMKSLVSRADIMKVSDEELALLTGEAEMEKAADSLLRQGVSVVVVTMGPKGCGVFTPTFSLKMPTYDTKVKDTTGSGDSFFGALLCRVAESGKHPRELSREELSDFADFANAAGAVCATQTGAIPALPDRKSIENCRNTLALLK